MEKIQSKVVYNFMLIDTEIWFLQHNTLMQKVHQPDILKMGGQFEML